MRSFGSDNHSGVHTSVIEAIIEANHDHDFAYGDDYYTNQLKQEITKLFGNSAEIFPVFNGTGANVCALRACTRPFNSIIATDTAHIFVDECGAPEFLTGAAIKSIPTTDGKVTPLLLKKLLHGFGFEHHSQPKVLYISECTELGTLYTISEIKELANILHENNMYLHLDGARLANAAAAMNCTFKALTSDCDIDILSFGGTKNGLMMGEAVITFRPELAENMKYLRKQSTQLYSKMRFCSAQFLAYFKDDLWRKNANHANEMAQLLRSKIENIGKFKFTQKTEANILLLQLPEYLIEKLLQNHFFYIWDESLNEVRFVTSWDTTDNDVNDLVEDILTNIN